LGLWGEPLESCATSYEAERGIAVVVLLKINADPHPKIFAEHAHASEFISHLSLTTLVSVHLYIQYNYRINKTWMNDRICDGRSYSNRFGVEG
jgi:hypothetical protein